MLKLHRELDLEPGRPLALIGGGGKTTCALTLAQEAARAGHPAVVYATTHIGRPEGLPVFCAPDPVGMTRCWQQGQPVVAGEPLSDGRLTLPDAALLDWLRQQEAWFYIEADGSRQLPLKFPAAWEPALPDIGEQLLLVVGLSALGQPLGRCCQRWELAARQLDLTPEAIVDEQLLARILLLGFGALQPQVLINQADTPQLSERGRRVAAALAAGGLTRSRVLSLHKLSVKEGRDLE